MWSIIVNKELIMYGRSMGCPFITVAKRVLKQYDVEYRELFIDKDEEARRRVLTWTGFLSVPTLIVAHPGELDPMVLPEPLPARSSPRGINRGDMITEPSADELTAWLRQHELIPAADPAS